MKGEPVDLDKERKARQPRCWFCMSLEHAEYPLSCPRVRRVDLDLDQNPCSIYLLPYEEEDPDDAA